MRNTGLTVSDILCHVNDNQSPNTITAALYHDDVVVFGTHRSFLDAFQCRLYSSMDVILAGSAGKKSIALATKPRP